nr:hypothetical protein [Tanacetum cinerariifolium]
MFLIAARFPTPSLACAFFIPRATVKWLGDGEVCQRCTCTRCGSGLSKGLCYICGNNQNSLNDSPNISVNSSQNSPHIDKCCYECGDTLDGIFCQRCTCKSCGKGDHIGYNCPPKVLIISNLEPCNQTMNNEPPQTLPSFDPTCYSEKENSLPCVSKPDFVDESPDVFNPPLQPPIYSCEFCGSNAQNGHYYTPQVLFIYPEPGYSQDINFPQDFHDFQQHLEVAEIVIPEDEEIEDDNLREKLLNVNLLIAKIEALKDNPTPSSEFLTKSSSTSPKSFLKETNTFPPTDMSDFTHEEFSDELTYIISLPEYDCFYFRNFPDLGEWISSLNSEIRENLSSTTRVNLPVEDDHSPLLAYVVWIFLAYLTYPVIPHHLHSFENKDTIFDPGIAINRFYSFKPGLSHRCGTFKKLNTHRSHLNDSSMKMLFSTFFPMDQ